MYEVILTDDAERDLARLDRPVRRRILDRLDWLSRNADTTSLEAMTGDLTGLYKFRVGNYRVLYDIDRNERIILVHVVRHRRDVYR